MFGVTAGVLLLLIHLAGLDSLGLPYLAPYSQMASPEILRPRLVREKFRPHALKPRDRRNQK